MTYAEKKTAWERSKYPLYTIEIHFDQETDAGYQRWYIHNQSWMEIRSIRDTVFTHGFFLERAPGRGEVVFPWHLRKILIDIQKTWKDEQTITV